MKIQARVDDIDIYKAAYLLTQRGKVSTVSISEIVRIAILNLIKTVGDLTPAQMIEAKGRLYTYKRELSYNEEIVPTTLENEAEELRKELGL